MVLRLVERLGIPLRERNTLLTAAGFAPLYAVRPLSDPELGAALTAVDAILQGHEPYPAVLVDRYWNLVAANGAASLLMAGIDACLTTPPVNVLRVSLHPDGLAPRIENLAQWRAHLLARLRRDLDLTGDPKLAELMQELRSYAGHAGSQGDAETVVRELVVPLRLRTAAGVLSLFSTTTIFGTAAEVTLSELVLEAFYPADEITGELLKRAAAAGASVALVDQPGRTR